MVKFTTYTYQDGLWILNTSKILNKIAQGL